MLDLRMSILAKPVNKGFNYKYLVHQDFDTSIQTRSNRFIQCPFEPFLFLHRTVQEISLVDICGLKVQRARSDGAVGDPGKICLLALYRNRLES